MILAGFKTRPGVLFYGLNLGIAPARGRALPRGGGTQHADGGLEEAMRTGLAEGDPDGALVPARRPDLDDRRLETLGRIGLAQADPDGVTFGGWVGDVDQ